MDGSGIEPALRAWTRFACRGWRDEGVATPRGSPPAAGIERLGLAPLLFRALRDRQDARAGLFAAAYHRAAGQNLALFGPMARARDTLLDHGITPLLIKGGAFLLRHAPGDLGVRALADLDVLVGPERFDEALARLTEAGWRRLVPALRYSSRVAPAIALVSTGARGISTQLDLHRHLAQWPLLKELPARAIAQAETVGGWPMISVAHSVLLVAAHRTRHAFANDARDLVDLAAAVTAIDDAAWARVVEEGAGLGLTGALYAVMRQAAWWLDEEDGAIARRAAALRSRLHPARAALLDRLADPAFVLARSSPWAGPLGRNFGVFPAAFHAPWRSLVAAIVFLPRRALEGR